MKFEKISCINSNQFGNKAQNLCKLINLGFNVPDGICLDYEYFNLYKNDNLTYLIKIKDVFNYIEEHLKSQNGWIVRSSSEIEDSEEFSAAGIYKSIYIDKLDKLYDAIKIVFDSNYNMVNLGARIGVIIQEYIEPEYSGVSFSCNPINNNQKALIEFVKGRCNQIVDGLVIPNRIDFNLEIDNNILIKYPFIKSIEMKTNLLAKKIGKNVDLEWVFKDSKVYLVQLRTVVMKNLPQDNILYKFDALSLGEWVLLDGVALPLTPVEKSLDLSGTLHFRAWDSKIVNDYHYVKFKENMNSNSNNDINFIKEWERNEKKYKKLLKDITDIKTLENIELWDYLVRAIKQSRELYRVYMNRAWFANRKVLQKSLLEDLKTISSNAIEASNLLANLCTEVDSKTLDK
ncbi:phosphoenolpyruvate synthase/pyruvate phosphate dikinase [Clostridium beijerinckii]|nr:PEP/pyruvate-binding domain-containing protein [Clostridium beijerinckii]MBA8932411.1 phosphoenolpyruvate synthase/pyruvate phosphate dikinase [Clostridium beijerinckii]